MVFAGTAPAGTKGKEATHHGDRRAFAQAPAGAADTERHLLDPLSAAEIEAAVRILRAERCPGPSIRFETVELKEPPKAVLRAYGPACR